MFRTFIFSVAYVTSMLTATSAQASRIALVIANENYSFAPLLNPVRDARLVADQLALLDFEVLYAENLEPDEFRSAVEDAREKISEAEIFVLYYAGHALQYRGDNLLLMTGISEAIPEEIIDGSVSLTGLISEIARYAPDVLVLALDACRDTPLAESSSEFQTGLSYVESSDQEMLIGYATSAGQVAYDGAGSNGPYAIALANALSEPEVSLSRVFREVRRRVRESTAGAQIPWVSSSIEREVILRHSESTMPALPTTSDMSEWIDRIADIVWTYVKDRGSVDYFVAFENAFPGSVHIPLARQLTRTAQASRTITIVQAAQASENQLGMTQGAVVSLGEFGTTVDRYPIEEMRIWPLELPAVDKGLRTIVDECDLLAGDPDDPAGVTLGVHRSLVSWRDAIPACGFAASRHPEESRYVFQLARALDIAGHVDWAIPLYVIAGDRGYSQSLVNLGHLYRFGVKVPADYEKAFEYYHRAALIGNPQARMGLSILYMNGWGAPQSIEESILWARLAGSQGWTNAYDMLATHYIAGRGVEKDLSAAFKLFLYAAQMGQTNAMSNLGLAYLKGEGTEKSEDLGMEWLRAADVAGNRYAAYHLGRFARGSSPTEAEQHFLRSAERDFPQARVELAKLYVEQDRNSDAYFQLTLANRLGYSADVTDLTAQLERRVPAATREEINARVERWLDDNGY